MIIKIDDEKKLAEVQQEFSQAFSNLKLEFFADTYASNGNNPVTVKFGGDSSISKVRVLHTNGFLSIEPESPIYELVENCADIFGLNVRVYQKEGEDVWRELEPNSDRSLEYFNNEIISPIADNTTL